MIEKILDKNNIAYKVIDGEGNTTIIKINGKLHTVMDMDTGEIGFLSSAGNLFDEEDEW